MYASSRVGAERFVSSASQSLSTCHVVTLFK
jgi:hypothetical protein